jgi:hypothetical protein
MADTIRWFGCCGRHTVWAQDFYPEERERHTRELQGDVLVGEFPTRQEAMNAAMACLVERRRTTRAAHIRGRRRTHG